MKDYLYAIITGRTRGVIPSLLIGLLTPLSYLYAAVVTMRGWFYDCGFLKQQKLPCAVISVGNIVAGGTGKTPTVIWIARYLRNEGYQVGVLLRGYQREGHRSVTIVSDGKRILAPVTASGDEARMIAHRLPGVPVVVGNDRYAAGLEAVQLWGHTDGVLILDDGFQRRQLARELDIVTIDSTNPFGTGRLLPAGTLRESKGGLKRADILMLTRTDLAVESTNLDRLAHRKQIIESCHQPMRLYRLSSDEKFSLEVLKGQCLLAVCGIGNPEAFVGTLSQYKPKSVELLAFPDHHRYSATDFSDVVTKAREIGAAIVVTTEKDAEKLASLAGRTGNWDLDSVPFLVLGIELKITTNLDALKDRLKQIITEPQSGLKAFKD